MYSEFAQIAELTIAPPLGGRRRVALHRRRLAGGRPGRARQARGNKIWQLWSGAVLGVQKSSGAGAGASQSADSGPPEQDRAVAPPAAASGELPGEIPTADRASSGLRPRRSRLSCTARSSISCPSTLVGGKLMPHWFSEQLGIATQTGIKQMIEICRQARIRAIGETGYRAIPTQQGQERLKLAHISGDRKSAQ